MNYSADFFEKEARKIINLLKKDFLLEDGSFCLEKVGEKKRPYHIFHDMGDFLPFLLYFGEEEFADKQISIFKNLLQDGLWVSEHLTWGIRDLVKSYEYTDLLYGLVSYYEFKKDKESYNLLVENVERAIAVFKFSKKPSSFYLKNYKINFPIQDSRDGMFIELLVDLSEVTGDAKYIEIANNLFYKLISNKFYKKYHLLPDFCARGLLGFVFSLSKRDFFRRAEIMKYNTNCLHAFLALFRKTGNKEIYGELIKMIEGIKKYALFDNGGIVKTFIPNQPNKEAFLGSSFSMIDFLCDFYYYFKREEDLKFAQEIGDFWISKQGKTGLFPFYSDKKESFFDFETDMSVALSKLFELTGRKEYQEAIDNCIDGIFKWHGKRNYILGVDIDSGEIINGGQRTKFISLFLKLVILKLEQFDGKKIYSDKRLLNIIEDR